ncbi:TANC1 [Symbiodinium pilosum]|uniref:TANC1 protein n=1 Tax=Symbiodinium pilosum TaxID=2952 RepID=A0A812TGG9_SYMPI|nr:TANC1 [Symbiodinium pilosum]
MRQWAVPGANSKWGGPPGCAILQEHRDRDPRYLRGPAVAPDQLRPEALAGTGALLRTAAELKSAGWTRVNAEYASCVPLHDRGYHWGKFEIHEEIVERLVHVAHRQVRQHPGETIVLVSHGGPTQYALRGLSGQKPQGAGGMTAMSVLRALPGDFEDQKSWEVLVSNDASHAQAFAHGVETKI